MCLRHVLALTWPSSGRSWTCLMESAIIVFLCLRPPWGWPCKGKKCRGHIVKWQNGCLLCNCWIKYCAESDVQWHLIFSLLVTTSADQTARIWKTSDFTLLQELRHEAQRWVWDAAFSADSQYILTGSLASYIILVILTNIPFLFYFDHMYKNHSIYNWFTNNGTLRIDTSNLIMYCLYGQSFGIRRN